MAEEKKEYKTEVTEKTLLDQILEDTVNFYDSQGNEIKLSEKATRRQYAPKHTDLQWEQVKDTIEACGLDPRRKEVYSWIVNEYDRDRKKIGEKVLIVTSYLVYIARALASGKLKSMPIIELDDSAQDMMNWEIKITIERKDIEGKFVFPGWFKESTLKRGMWLPDGRPKFMFMKGAVSLALRWALADVLGGMPYTQEEIDAGLDKESESQGVFIPSGNELEFKDKLEDEKENNEKVGNEFLDNLMKELTECKTLKVLEAKYKRDSKKYELSEMKDSILSLYASRKKQLQIELLATQTGFSAFQVDSYLEQAGDIDTLIAEAVAGNVDANDDLKVRIESFVNTPIEPLREEEQEELDLTEMNETIE